jgi:hypothetical protein
MISSYQTENKIICTNFQNALSTLKEKLYYGDYYTSTLSSVCIAYNRRIHRYQVFSSQDKSFHINENPRSKENYDTIRILDIPTSSDDFDKCIESQRELVKLNNNLSDWYGYQHGNMIHYDKEEDQANDIRKQLIDGIVYIQSSSISEKEAAHFEYDDGNSEIAKRCIRTITKKYKEQLDYESVMSMENIQHMLSQEDIPNEVAKELVILIFKDRSVH